jgi:hypothetical protein
MPPIGLSGRVRVDTRPQGGWTQSKKGPAYVDQLIALYLHSSFILVLLSLPGFAKRNNIRGRQA